MSDVLNERVIEELQIMYKHYNRPLDDDELVMWDRELTAYTPEDAVNAIRKAMKQSKDFIPRIGRVLEVLRDDRAARVGDDDMYAFAWRPIHTALKMCDATRVQQLFTGTEGGTRTVMLNRIMAWIKDACGDENKYGDIMCELDYKMREQHALYGFVIMDIIDELPWIMGRITGQVAGRWDR